MTTPTAFPITMAQIAAECGSSNMALEAYYAGAGIINPGSANGAGTPIPSSGAISYSNFLNFTFAISANSLHTSGSGTETVPTGAGNVSIEIFGATGTGGVFSGTGASAYEGGGGGSGGFARTVMAVTAGHTFAYTVGTTGLNTTVSSGTQTLTTMTATSGGNGGAASAGHGGTAGTAGTASGGNNLNAAGNAGTAGVQVVSSNSSTGRGGTGDAGNYASGNAGGNGGTLSGNNGAGQPGVINFHYTH